MFTNSGFWFGFGAFTLGTAVEKWFVYFGWPDSSIVSALLATAGGLVALGIAPMFVKETPTPG